MKTSLSDWPKVYRRLQGMRGLSEDKKIGFARALAGTPDERWEMNTNCLKALGLWGGVHSLRELERQKAKLRRMEQRPGFWRLKQSDAEMAARKPCGLDKVKPRPGKSWLPDMDLNHDKQIQSLLCYRYTIGQSERGKPTASPPPVKPATAWAIVNRRS